MLERNSDSSQKRNLGLLVARVAGWERVLLLDDDIDALNAGDVGAAARLLDSYDAVGLANEGFPDNSVVCHAHRDLGGRQSQFIGAGALAVPPLKTRSFFPHIYNADWLFLIGDHWRARVAVTGSMMQREFDPYADPDRARSEEFGECIAEGLYWLLDDHEPFESASQEYWSHFLGRRRRFIDGVARKVRRRVRGPKGERMLASLEAAMMANKAITPELCTEFVERWRADLATWREFIDGQPTGLGIDQAVVELGLAGTAHWSNV